MTRTLGFEELKDKLEERKSLSIVDLRDRDSFEHEHIKGALCVPLMELTDAEQLLNKDQEVVVYCDRSRCDICPSAAEKLERMGFKEVEILQEGFEEWKEKGGPVNKRSGGDWD